MNTKDQKDSIRLLHFFDLAASVGFAVWQKSVGAGFFLFFLVLLVFFLAAVLIEELHD